MDDTVDQKTRVEKGKQVEEEKKKSEQTEIFNSPSSSGSISRTIVTLQVKSRNDQDMVLKFPDGVFYLY